MLAEVAEAEVVHRGRTQATAEARLVAADLREKSAVDAAIEQVAMGLPIARRTRLRMNGRRKGS